MTTPFPWSAENRARLIQTGKAGFLSTQDQALIAEMLEYYSDACTRYEKYIHDSIK